MAQDVIREHGIKTVVVKRETRRNVALLETRLSSKASCQRELVRIAHSGRIDVQPDETAAHSFRKV
jgi:hypothetical protein